MSDTTKEDKEITMYPEDLTVDCDEVYEGICEELRFRGIEVTKAGFRWTINIELLQEDDDEDTARISDPRYREDRSY
jgi:hypothetical protein